MTGSLCGTAQMITPCKLTVLLQNLKKKGTHCGLLTVFRIQTHPGSTAALCCPVSPQVWTPSLTTCIPVFLQELKETDREFLSADDEKA